YTTLFRSNPVRPVLGTLLFEKVVLVDAVRIALQREESFLQVRQQPGRDSRVVVDHLPLGEARGRVEDLIEVRELELAALDYDFDCGRAHALLPLPARAGFASSAGPPPPRPLAPAGLPSGGASRSPPGPAP